MADGDAVSTITRERGCAMSRRAPADVVGITELSSLGPGAEFVVYDEFDEDRFPSTYLFKEWKLAKQICVAENQDTKEEFYVVGGLDVDYSAYNDRPLIVVFSSRKLYKKA